MAKRRRPRSEGQFDLVTIREWQRKLRRVLRAMEATERALLRMRRKEAGPGLDDSEPASVDGILKALD